MSYPAHKQNERINDRMNDHTTPPALAELIILNMLHIHNG